ncbi:MAG: hypothetical protein AAF575_00200 [Bacteroidota bacterium]
MKRILIIEDEPTLSDAYLFILNRLHKQNKIDAFVPYVCNSYERALDTIRRMALASEVPMACILDYRLKESKHNKKNGLELGMMIRDHFPACKILFITSITDKYLFHSIIQTLNPSAFLVKSDIDQKRTAEDILSVLEGKLVYSKAINDFVRNNPYSNNKLDMKDVQMVRLLRKRFSVPQIASQMDMSVSGVEYRKRRLAEKLGAPSPNINDIIATFENEMGEP